jgi:hypothetical protein
MEAVRELVEAILPLMKVEWVDREQHDAAVVVLLAANRRDLSLADCVSFATMRRLGLLRAFTVDEHFREQGFECLPA